MAALLDWEKEVKKTRQNTKPQQTQQKALPAPIRTASSSVHAKKDYYAKWDKFDVDAEITKVDNPTPSPSSTTTPSAAANESTSESQEQLEIRLETSLIQKEKGNAYFKKAEYPKAVKAYSKSLKLNPGNVLVLGNRAMTYLKMNEFSLAESDCTAVLAQEPKNVKALWRRGVSRRELGSDLAGAKSDLEKALVLEPTNTSVKQELSKVVGAVSVNAKPKGPIRKRVEIIEVGDPKAYRAPGHVAASTDLSTSLVESMDRVEPAKLNSTESKPLASPIIELVEEPTLKSAAAKPLIVDLSAIESVLVPAAQESVVLEPLVAKKPINSVPVAVAASPSPVKPPTSMYEFELEWKTRKSSLEALYFLIKAIDPTTYCSIFKNSFETQYLTKIVEVLKAFYVVHEPAQLLYTTLQGLSMVDRFSMNVMFCSSKEKQVIKELFVHLEAEWDQVDGKREDLEVVKKKFGVKK
ncbi:RNA polymerase II-associated protein 3 [Podochytrium sp. JEL0797]|nr:RNA polymerase II-associated protein 3 [Podochytrium sp. JEL0797]